MGDTLQHLHTRPLLSESRHMALFSVLTPIEVGRVVVRMQQDHLLPPHLPLPDVPERTGQWLFQLCSQMELDHASVVFPLCGEADSIGVSALEKLVGHPITRVTPRYNPRAWAARQTARQQAVARGEARPMGSGGGFTPDQVVLRVVPNPKKPGSATWHRFKNWVPGRTVAECMTAGLTRADVLWDTDAGRGFVALGTREEWEHGQHAGDEESAAVSVSLETEAGASSPGASSGLGGILQK